MIKKILTTTMLITLLPAMLLACKVEIKDQGVLWDDPVVEVHQDFTVFKYGYDPLRITLNSMTLQNSITIEYSKECYNVSKNKKSIAFKKVFFEKLTKLKLQRLVIALNPFYYNNYSKTYYLLDK
jgi:hypothetical protein